MELWDTIKTYAKKVGRALGLIQNLRDITDHKQINVSDEAYRRIDLNKQMYSGHVKEWHDLRYRGTNGVMIERKQMSLNMPKHIAKKLAKLTFNEGVKISLAEETKSAQWELISDVFTGNKFIRDFQRYLEYMFAMGGVVVEVYLDGDEPKIAYATADAFFPLSNDSEEIDEAVIANVFNEGGYTYTLLKWHEWLADKDIVDGRNYRIKNELYRSTNGDDLGDKVKLKVRFPKMAPETKLALERPMFTYLKPNEANNKEITSPLGVGIFENALDTIKLLDVMYDFWYNEFRLGKRRVAVPEYLVQSGINPVTGEPYYFMDDAEELFVAMNSEELDKMEMKDLTVDLRTEQVISSIQALLDILSMQVGLSVGSFTFGATGLKTATQVVSENSETYQTRSSHLNIIEDGLRDLILTVYEVACLALDQTPEPLERTDISIDWNDGVFIDKDAQLKFYAMAVDKGLAPKLQAIMSVFGKSKEEAEEWLGDINAERTQSNLRLEEAIAEVELGGAIER